MSVRILDLSKIYLIDNLELYWIIRTYGKELKTLLISSCLPLE